MWNKCTAVHDLLPFRAFNVCPWSVVLQSSLVFSAWVPLQDATPLFVWICSCYWLLLCEQCRRHFEIKFQYAEL